MLREGTVREEVLDQQLADLTQHYSIMMGGTCSIRPTAATAEEKKALIRDIARAAVFLRAHNWADRDLEGVQRTATALSTGDLHRGEIQASDGLDALGYVMLADHGDADSWAFTLLKEAAGEDERLAGIVKAVRYVVDPSFLLVLGDATKMTGAAVSAMNLRNFADCVQNIQGSVEVVPGPSSENEDVLFIDLDDLLGIEQEPLPELDKPLDEPSGTQQPLVDTSSRSSLSLSVEELELLSAMGERPLSIDEDWPHLARPGDIDPGGPTAGGLDLEW